MKPLDSLILDIANDYSAKTIRSDQLCINNALVLRKLLMTAKQINFNHCFDVRHQYVLCSNTASN